MSIVVAYPTVQDGLVLRWYRGAVDAEQGDEYLSASRNGFMIKGKVTDVECADAERAYLALARGDLTTARALLTHKIRRQPFALVPVETPSA